MASPARVELDELSMGDLLGALDHGAFSGKQVHGQYDGVGTYKFSSGTKFRGNFSNGMFHGEGDIEFPDGGVVHAQWDNGRAIKMNYVYADGLEHQVENWDYCTSKDRRFWSERCDDSVPPQLQTRLSNGETKSIPIGCYDIGNGYLNPETKLIYDYENVVTGEASEEKMLWAKTRCRISTGNNR